MKTLNGLVDPNNNGMTFSICQLPYNENGVIISKIGGVGIKQGTLIIIYTEILNFAKDYSKFSGTNKYLSHFIIDGETSEGRKFVSDGMVWKISGEPMVFDSPQKAFEFTIRHIEASEVNGIDFSNNSENIN